MAVLRWQNGDARSANTWHATHTHRRALARMKDAQGECVDATIRGWIGRSVRVAGIAGWIATSIVAEERRYGDARTVDIRYVGPTWFYVNAIEDNAVELDV